MEAVNGGSLGEDKGGPPPPSPLTGCYLLVVVGEPHSSEHKDIILQRVAKGLLSWDAISCLVDLEKELSIITDQGLEGEEARYGERLIQFASENLVTEILIHPAVSTLSQCVRNLLSSFTRHRHIIHAGYTFQGNGSWALQDGTFSYSDFSEAFQEIDVQRVIHAYENGISIDLHCSPEGDWTRLPKETFTKASKVRVNPTDVLSTGSPSISNFIKYLTPFLVPTSLENILESSDVVGNIRFSRPTLYVFPGGQGDAALFGINGFNMLLDGGYSRKACFWDFVRHLDRLDAVLMTRLNNSSICGISSVLKRKRQGAVYPQVGHFFCNIQERKSLLSPDGDKDRDPLIFSILEEGQSIVHDLQYLNLTSQPCYRDSEPIILYHKVGHGTLNMYVLSPDKNSREVREFLQKWNHSDPKMFLGTRGGRDFSFPLQNLVSICALLVWQPANPNDTITRILYPGSTPQKKIFEGFERLKNLEYIKHPLCSEKSLAPVKKSKQDVIDKLASKDKVISEKRTENKLIEDALKNGEINGDVVREKQVKKSDSLESDKEKKTKKVEEKKLEESKKAEKIEDVEKIVENGEKAKTKTKYGDAKPIKKRGDSQHRKKATAERKGPTTPKKSIENKMNGETKDKEKDRKAPQKPSPSTTPAKSTKDANNRRVIESKKTPPKKEAATKSAPPTEAKPKPERKPISRRPKTVKGPPSPMKKMTNGVQKPDSISKRGKLDKEGTTDSSTVSTPSADQDSVLKKDISKLTPEEIEQLKEKELDELKEEQEAVKEIEAVFRKGEGHVEEAEPGVRKIKDMSIDDNLDTEEYLIIEKEEIEHDSLDQETKEDEMQKLARDSEESEKQRKLSSEEKEIDIQKKEIEELPTQELENVFKDDAPVETIEDTDSKKLQVSSPEDKATPTTDKKELADEDVKEVVESHPEEKVSANVESGATTTAPTLPEDERITLDDIKEDNDQPIEEKHVKEETKEKEVPVIQLPPQSQQDSQPKIPLNVGISLDKQKHIRDIVKTPDEVADLPVHEEADFHEFHGDGKKSTEVDSNEQVKDDKKVEEKKDDKQIVDSKEKVDEKEKTEEIENIIVEDQVQKEVLQKPTSGKKDDEIDITKKKEVVEEKNETDDQDSKKEIIEELFAVKEIVKDISKDVKNESQAFLDQEKAAHDFAKDDAVPEATTQVPVVEITAEITESIPEKSLTKSDFEILEKAELETKEKIEKEIDATLLKESIDDEWVVITKEEDEDIIETAQEAEKAMKEKKDDLKEAPNVDKVVEAIKKDKEPEDHKHDLKEKVLDSQKHEQPEAKEEALPDETKKQAEHVSVKEKAVAKEEVVTEPPITPQSPKEDVEGIKEKEIESEGEYDHEPRKEDEIQEIIEHDREDIKALIEEADKKTLHDQKESLDVAKNVTETPVTIEEKITHMKEIKQEVAFIDDKIQELKKDVHESVEELSFSRTKRDLCKIEDEPLQSHLRQDAKKLTNIDDKLQELKHTVEEASIEKEFKIEKSTKSPEHAEQVTLPDSSPDESDHLTFGDLDIDKTELGRKSPAEREEDVKKIVVSVAEVLKSEAPLEEFQGKLPFTQELRETHITTQDSPIVEAKVIITDDIPPIPEEPVELKDKPTDIMDRRKDLIAGAQELMAASSKVISDIKSKAEEKVDKVEEGLEIAGEKQKKEEETVGTCVKETDVKEKEEQGDKEESDDKDEKDDDSGIVHRMLVTASSEDGGEEIEICPVGTITFSKSSESSGRSSPEPSQKTQSQKSSIVETLSDTLSTVKQITEKDLDNERGEDQSTEKHGVLDSLEDAFNSAKEFLKEKIQDISKDTAKVETQVGEDENIVSIETVTKAEIKEVKGATEDREETRDDIEDFTGDTKKIGDKTTEVLEAVSSKVEELSEKAKVVNDKINSTEKEDIKMVEDLTNLEQNIVEDLDKILSHSKDTPESTPAKIDKTVEEIEEIIDQTSKEPKDKAEEVISDAKKIVTSIAEDAVLKTDDVTAQLDECVIKSVDKIKEIKDEAMNKSKEILTDISGSTVDAKETIESKVGDILTKSEEVKDLIKEEIKEVKDKAVDKSKEMLTDIIDSTADGKETLESKVDDTLKTSEVKDLIKEEIKDVKDKAVDKSKESLTDIIDSTVDTKKTIESKVDDTLKTSEEVKDLIKEEIKEVKDKAVDKSKEILTDIIGSTADTKETIESKVGDTLKTSEEVKDLIKEEIKEVKDKAVDESKESLTDIIDSTVDAKETMEFKVGDNLKTSEEVKDLIKEEIKDVKDKAVDKSKESLTDIIDSTVDTKKTIESKVDDTLKTSEEVKDLIKEEIKEVKDKAVDKSKEILTDIIGSTADTKETIESKVGDTLKTSEEVKDLIKEEIKEVKDKAVEKSTDISDSTVDAKETMEIKVGDNLKTSEEVKDLIKEEIKDVKDKAEDKSKEIYTDIIDSTVDAKKTIESKVGDTLKTSEEVKDLIKEEIKDVKDTAVDKSEESLTDIIDSTVDTKKTIESKVDDTLKTSEEVKDLIKEEIKEVKDKAVDKSKEILTDIIDSTVDTKETIESKVGDTLKTSEEVKDLIKEEIKEVKDKAVDKSKEILTDIIDSTVDTKETIESKVGDTLKTSEEVKDLIKEEIREVKDKAEDKSKEIYTDIIDSTVDAKKTIESKVGDTLKTSEEVKDLIKEEIKERKDEAVVKSKESLADIIDSTVDTKETIESKVGDTLKTSEEVKGLIKEEIKEVKDKAVEKSTDISDSIVDAKETIESKVGDTLKTSEVKDLIKEEIKEVKDKAGEKSTDISDSTVDVKETIETKAVDDLKTSKDIKDLVIEEIKEVRDEAMEKTKEMLTDISGSTADVGETIESQVNDVLKTCEEVKDLMKEETTASETLEKEIMDATKNIPSIAMDSVSEGVRLDEKHEQDLSQAKQDTEHKFEDTKKATAPLSKDSTDSATPEVNDYIEKTEIQIMKDTKMAVEQKKVAEDVKEVTSMKQTLTGEDEQCAKTIEEIEEPKLDDVHSKIEAESSKITGEVKDEFTHVGTEIEKKIKDSKELVLDKVDDLVTKTDEVQTEVKKFIEDKVEIVEAKLPDIKDIITDQTQEVMDKSKDVAEKIKEDVKEDLKNVEEDAVEVKKDVSGKIGAISASILDVADKIEETIGIKMENIDEKVDNKVESKLEKEQPTTTEEKTQRRESVVEKAEELLEKSEQAIGSVFSAIGDAVKSVLHEVIPVTKSSDSETKIDKAEIEHLVNEGEMERTKLDSTLDPTEEILRSSSDIPKEKYTKEEKKAEDSDKSQMHQDDLETATRLSEIKKLSEKDISASITDATKTTSNTTENKVNDIGDKVKELDHAISVVKESLDSSETAVAEKVVKEKKDIVEESLENVDTKTIDEQDLSEVETVRHERRASVVEKAEALLEKSEKAIESAFSAISDAAKSVFHEMLPDHERSDTETKIDVSHIEEEKLSKRDSIEDSTAFLGKTDSDVLGKDLEDLQVISGKSITDISKGKTVEEAENLEIVDQGVKTIIMAVTETEEKKDDASDKGLEIKKPDDKDSNKIFDKPVEKQEHGGIIEAAEEFIEKSEKAFESVFSAIGGAAQSILHDVAGEKGSEEKDKSKEKEKTDDKKEDLQQEEKEIEDDVKHDSHELDANSDLAKSILFDSSTSDKSKIDKEILEKKIVEEVEEHASVIFEKCKPSDAFKIDKKDIEREEKQIEDQVSHLEQSLEEVKGLSKSISFDKCHIAKEEDKIVQKQIDALENTLEKVSDMTKTIVLEKDEQTLNASKTEQKEIASSSVIFVDSNKLEDMHRSSDDTCEKEELIHGQEKKDPEKEHTKLEDQLEGIKQAKSELKDEFPKEVDRKSQDPSEHLKDSTECDITKSVQVEKSYSSPKSHKLDDQSSESGKPEKSKDILKKDDPSPNAKDSVVLEDQHISSQTEKCERESMEKTSSEKDSSSLKVERSEHKKLSISDVEISIKTEECPKDASQSFLDNERVLLRDNIDAKVYVHPVSSQDDDKISIDKAGSSSILQVNAEVPMLSDKYSPDLELSGKTTPPTVPVSPVPKEVKSPSLKLDSGLSEQTETDDEDLSTKSQVAHSQSDLDELDMKMDPMSMSFYGALPGEQGDVGEEVPATLLYEMTKAKFTTELQQEDQESATKKEVDLMTASFIGELPSASSDLKSTTQSTDSKEDGPKKDAVDSWGKPLGLPAPTYLYEVTTAKLSSSSDDTNLMTCSFIGDALPTSSSQDQTQVKSKPRADPMTTGVYFERSGDSGYDPIASWGKPLGLPSPAPPNNNEKGTPKKERKLPAYVTAKNKLNDDKKRAESPSKLKAKKINPVYVDLTYVPHHGNHYYSYVDYFKKIRARYYVFSGLEPSRQVYDALLEAKQTWEDKELEVTIIPTYDTDILGYWVAENEELLSKFKIDLSPSASRCTINLQDHETSCSAYRLEF